MYRLSFGRVIARVARRLRIGWPRAYTALIGTGSYAVAGQDVTLAYTPASDTTPNQFTFTDQTGVALSTVVTSAPVTISGLSTGTSITLNASGGTIDKNGDANFLGSQIVQNGDTVRARVTSSASSGVAANCSVVASPSGVQDTFTATTTSGGAIGSPAANFNFYGSSADGGTLTIESALSVFGTKPNSPKPYFFMGTRADATASASLGRVTTYYDTAQFSFQASGGPVVSGGRMVSATATGAAGVTNEWTMGVRSDSTGSSGTDFNAYGAK